MVLPLLLIVTAVGGGAYLADKLGILDSENAGEVVGNVVAETASAVMSVIPTVLGELAPALIDGVAESVKGARKALEGREIAFTPGVTCFLIGYAGFRALKSMTGGVIVAQSA